NANGSGNGRAFELKTIYAPAQPKPNRQKQHELQRPWESHKGFISFQVQECGCQHFDPGKATVAPSPVRCLELVRLLSCVGGFWAVADKNDLVAEKARGLVGGERIAIGNMLDGALRSVIIEPESRGLARRELNSRSNCCCPR